MYDDGPAEKATFESPQGWSGRQDSYRGCGQVLATRV